MANNLDFAGLASVLLARSRELVASWLPGGRMVGREYTCGSLRGGPGDSCKVNVDTGKWADFSTEDRGKDLVSLYAKMQGLTQGKAARQLADQIGFQLDPSRPPNQQTGPIQHVITAPPEGVIVPDMIHARHGRPSATWCYRSAEGKPIFYVARYDTPTGKEFCPWSWSSTVGRWVQRGYPEPRPLYGLDLLASRPDAPVMLVEGEKAADAARQLAGKTYAVVTWPNGSKAVAKTDWAPLQGRKVLVWPDADEPGVSACKQIAEKLAHGVQHVKVIDVSDHVGGWDAADAVAEGWDWGRFVEWAKPRAAIFAQATATVRGTNGVAAAQANVHVSVHTDDDHESSASLYALYEELGIATNSHGKPYTNVDNATRVIAGHRALKTRIWWDVFHRKYYTTWNGAEREWTDVDSLALAEFMQRELGLHQMSDDIAYKAVQLYGHQHARNAPRDWMETLTWDGTPRCERFFVDYFGTQDSAYARAVSKNFWVAMIARIYSPGCKVDTMVILEGAQGIYKSTALDSIGREWYAEAHESVTSKDFFMILQGKLLVEIAELDSFRRAEITRIKQVVSCRTDRYRSPYGRVAEDHPRMSVFVATTNEQTYLRDDTGARRFWPIKCGTIDLQRIRADREQLFAEAVTLFKSGATWYEMPKEETKKEQEARRQVDEWEGLVYDWLMGKSEITVREIATECLKIDSGKLDLPLQKRIGGILRILGWDRMKDWNHGDQRRVWRRGDAPEELVPF